MRAKTKTGLMKVVLLTAFLLLGRAAHPQLFGKTGLPATAKADGSPPAGLGFFPFGDQNPQGPQMIILASGHDEEGRLMGRLFALDANSDGEPDNYYSLSYERDVDGQISRKIFISYYDGMDSYDVFSDITYFRNEVGEVTDSFEEVDQDGDGDVDRMMSVHNHYRADTMMLWSVTLQYSGSEMSLERAQVHRYERGSLVEHFITYKFPSAFIDEHYEHGYDDKKK